MELVNRLSFLFGTEESVRWRRELVLLRENVLSLLHKDRGYRIICSGSLGEGVAYPPSDDDIMCSFAEQRWHVYEAYEEAISHRALYMIPSEYSPGFCMLQDVNNMGLEQIFLSSTQFRDAFVESRPGSFPHGPCASVVLDIHEYDHAPCFSCKHWPALANEWITRRRRYGWPSRELISEVIRNGCHVVPIGNSDSPLRDLEWRISFSLAERCLIHAFNHVQFIVYNFLKVINKRVISSHVPNVLCSYFLKTILYYTVENVDQALWAKGTIEECYKRCLLLLFYFIDTKNCPNYFLPDNNMMRRKVNESNRLPLLGLIRELMSRGIAGSLFLCSKEKQVLFPFLFHSDIEFKGDLDFICEYLLRAIMVDYRKFLQRLAGSDVLYMTARSVFSPIVSSYMHLPRNYDPSFLNLIIKKVFTLIGLRCIELSVRMPKGNTPRYQIIKYGQAMLTMGQYSDICSSRLLLASYMLMTGKFSHCLAIIQDVLSRITPYVMYLEKSKVATAERAYREVICNNGYSLDYKVRTAFALDIEFSPDMAEFAPVPVKMLLAQIKRTVGRHELVILLCPLVFAYFLQGLCFYQTHDHDSMNISVTLLENTIRSYGSGALQHIYHGRLLLGYITMIQQDYHSSCRCFISAYLMKEEMDKKYREDHSNQIQTSVILIACLLNRAACTN